MRETYQTDLPLPLVFSRRTPQELALLLAASPGNQSTTSIPKANRRKRAVQLTDDGMLGMGDGA